MIVCFYDSYNRLSINFSNYYISLTWLTSSSGIIIRLLLYIFLGALGGVDPSSLSRDNSNNSVMDTI